MFFLAAFFLRLTLFPDRLLLQQGTGAGSLLQSRWEGEDLGSGTL